MIAAVDIAQSVQEGLNALLGFIPNLIGFALILLIGWIVAKAVKAAVTKLLQTIGIDRALHQSDAGSYVERVSPGASPARLIATVVYWFIFLFVISVAISALKIPALTGFLNQVQGYLPNIVAAILIFVIAAVVAGAIGGAAHKLMGDTPTGRVVRAIAPTLILAIATFMVLNQLHIAPQIVTITYAALLGTLALAGGLAFGLGGRDVAGDMLRSAYDAGQRNADQVKRDVETGRERGELAAREQSDSAKGNTPAGATSTER